MKRDDVFEQLVPPPNGLAKLRERMARPSPIRRLVPVAATTLAIAAVLLLFLFSRRPPSLVAAARDHAGPDQVALGLAPPLDRSATLTAEERATTAMTKVPTSNPTVAFYWVSSTSD